MSDDSRPCTCAPDERPYPCQRKYALRECRKAENRALRAELDRAIAQLADLTRQRLADEYAHGNVMGRIAIALFSDQNNRTDEECVAAVAELAYEVSGAREALRQMTQERDSWMAAARRMTEPQELAAALAPPPPIIMPKSDFDWIRENDRLHQRIDRLEAIRTAASALICEAEECECAGLGLFAQHGWWEPLHEAIERADEADADGKKSA